MSETEVMEGEVVSGGEPGEKLGEPMAEVRDELRQARELVPIEHGVTPQNLAQAIDLAQVMAKARGGLPGYLHDNVGDCMALLDISSRAHLSPYMLAWETYLDPKSKRMAFQSRAYHALAQNWLVGDLDVAYEGEGENRVCIITGTTKKAPDKPRVYRSPPLSQVRPQRNAEGVTKGSPLWDRKPDVQLFYDTSRDWVRMFCPQATLGIYTGDELAQWSDDIEKANRAMRDDRSGVSERLANGSVDRTEGHRGTDHVDAELAQIAPASGGREIKPVQEGAVAPGGAAQDAPAETAATKTAAEPEKPTGEPATGKTSKRRTKAAEETKPADTGADKKAEAKAETPAQATAQPEAIPDTAPDGEVTQVVAAPGMATVDGPADTGAPAEPPIEQRCADATTWRDYLALWNERLKLATERSIIDEWKRERAVRERLKMPSEEITEFRNIVDRRAAQLAARPVNPLAAG